MRIRTFRGTTADFIFDHAKDPVVLIMAFFLAPVWVPAAVAVIAVNAVHHATK